MTARPSPSPRDTELSAFARGIEHHSLVLAENQCAHAGRARAAVIAGQDDFRERAHGSPPEAWSALYWRCLLAQPAMRARLRNDPRNPFSLLDPGPRAALLLRFVADLEQADAAQALDVSPEAYRHALYRAVQTLRTNGIDEPWMRAMRDRLRNDARPLHAESPDTGSSSIRQRARALPHWLRPALLAALGVLVFAGIGSLFWQPSFLRFGLMAPGAIETLRDQKPAEVLPATANLIASGDFALLADPRGASISRDLDLYSWYATVQSASTSPSNSPAQLPETTLPETSNPDVDTDPTEGVNAP